MGMNTLLNSQRWHTAKSTNCPALVLSPVRPVTRPAGFTLTGELGKRCRDADDACHMTPVTLRLSQKMKGFVQLNPPTESRRKRQLVR